MLVIISIHLRLMSVGSLREAVVGVIMMPSQFFAPNIINVNQVCPSSTWLAAHKEPLGRSCPNLYMYLFQHASGHLSWLQRQTSFHNCGCRAYRGCYFHSGEKTEKRVHKRMRAGELPFRNPGSLHSTDCDMMSWFLGLGLEDGR